MNNKLITNEIVSGISENKSIQIYIIDLEKNLFFRKEITTINYNEFFKFYEENYISTKDFFEDARNMLDSNIKFDKSSFRSLFKNNELVNIFFIKFNLPNNILHEKYNNKEYFEFISSCCLYHVLYPLEEENEIKNIYQYFIKFKSELEKDSNLENYMRNLIILEFSYIFESKKNLLKFEKINFTYYNRKHLEKDSPLYNAFEFLEKFIEDLDEKSPFIYPLILIDSGNFFYKKKDVYGLGLINKEILKSHLKNILPEILIFIDDEEEYYDQGSTNKVLGITVLNLASKYLSSLKKITVDKKITDLNINNNAALILFILLFHEILGHNRGGYSPKSNNFLLSPNVFYHKQKRRLLKLVDKNSQSSNDDEIKIIRDDDKDAGYFLEYFIGECKYGFFSVLIEKMLTNNVNLNFIFDNNLWNEKIEVMRKYIELKYTLFLFNKNLLNNKLYKDIYEEITDLEKTTNNINNELNTTIKESKNDEEKNIQKKRKDLSPENIDKKLIEQYERLTIEEIREKLKSHEISPELRDIPFKILIKRIRRK